MRTKIYLSIGALLFMAMGLLPMVNASEGSCAYSPGIAVNTYTTLVGNTLTLTDSFCGGTPPLVNASVWQSANGGSFQVQHQAHCSIGSPYHNEGSNVQYVDVTCTITANPVGTSQYEMQIQDSSGGCYYNFLHFQHCDAPASYRSPASNPVTILSSGGGSSGGSGGSGSGEGNSSSGGNGGGGTPEIGTSAYGCQGCIFNLSDVPNGNGGFITILGNMGSLVGKFAGGV